MSVLCHFRRSVFLSILLLSGILSGTTWLPLGSSQPAVAGVLQAPGLSDCPVDAEACSFAEALNGWLTSRDFDAVLAAWLTEGHLCPGPKPEGLGGPFPLCRGARRGELRIGYPFATETEGGVNSARTLRRTLRRWVAGADSSTRDGFGNGAFRFYSLACAPGPNPCVGDFAAVFSGVYPLDGGRAIRLIVAFVVNDGGRLEKARITVDVSLGIVAGRGGMLRGGTVQTHLLPGPLKSLNHFFAWQPGE